MKTLLTMGKTVHIIYAIMGIDASNVQRKFVSDIVWGEFIRYKFDSKFKELDSIVEKALLRIKKNSKKSQVRLSEIILLPDRNGR